MTDIKNSPPKTSNPGGKAEKKVVKTVNRTGKSLVKKALVVKAKKNGSVLKQVQNDKEKIKQLNEERLAQIKKDESARTDVLKSKEATAASLSNTDKPALAGATSGKPDKKYELTIGLKELLAAGCHLGHKVSKTHPKARDFIYGAREGIEVIDLTRTMDCLEKAANFIFNAKRNGKQMVMVGTKRQAREVVKRVAEDAGVPYVTDRWLGGTITNWDQIRKDIKKLAELKEGLEKGKFNDSTKKEQLEIKKEVIRLEKIIGGIRNVDRLFDIIFVVDGGFEKTAVKEAKMRNIKVVGMTDTDSNPNKLDYPIPANDDSFKSVSLIVEEIGKAIKSAGI
ncbi:MAG: 30S ribosomal protein S2 [Candidatus Shapirobacteria bacterium]